MKFTHENKNATAVVVVNETRLDAAVAPEFKKYVSEILNSGAKIIVLDVSSVDFIDSSGLGAIVSILKQLNGVGEIRIACPGIAVEGLLRLTRMDRIFHTFDSVEEALEVDVVTLD